jgi:transcriptional regulator with XRE-family HTH domain
MSFFSKNLRHLRTLENLSQEALAGMLALNRGNIASYEKGTAEPNISNLMRIARFFNVDPAELVETDLERNREILVILGEHTKETDFDGQDREVITGELQKQLKISRDTIESFRNRSDEMMKILEGFRQFHKYKMESGGELTEDMKQMALDYERLMGVLDEVLRSNQKLMALFDE